MHTLQEILKIVTRMAIFALIGTMIYLIVDLLQTENLTGINLHTSTKIIRQSQP